MSETSSASNLHVESVAKKSCQQNDNVGSILNVEHFSSSPTIFQQTSIENVLCDDDTFTNDPSMDDHIITSVNCTRNSDYSDDDTKSTSTENLCDQSIASVKFYLLKEIYLIKHLLQRNTS